MSLVSIKHTTAFISYIQINLKHFTVNYIQHFTIFTTLLDTDEKIIKKKVKTMDDIDIAIPLTLCINMLYQFGVINLKSLILINIIL